MTRSLPFADYHVAGDGLLLPKPPKPADRLVILLIAPSREKHGVIAVLPVQAHAGHLCLRNQAFDFAPGERDKDFFFS